MSLFPATPAPSLSIIMEQEFRTLITPFQSGKEQRRSLDVFPRRSVTLSYDEAYLIASEIDILFNFYRTMRGQWGSFNYFDLQNNSYDNEYVNRGDGITEIFDLPGKDTYEASLVIYVDGDETAVTFISGGGVDSADRIEFAEPPADGALITADINAKLKIKARFKNAKMSRERFIAMIFKTGLELIEVR